MGHRKKKEKVKRPRYCAKGPKYTHKPHLCSCGETLVRIQYIYQLRGRMLRWHCPKCGVL